jgi:fermentation-respiration switch protein FrsA (DUF1100 family)
MLPLGAGAVGMWALTHPGCSSVFHVAPLLTFEYEDVVIPSREEGVTLHGYYIPSQNGAHVIFPPAYGGGAYARLDEAEVLALHGYGLLGFESRSCAGKVNTLGYREVDDLAGALDWLLACDGVDPDRIGVHGFSSAGATAIMAAAQRAELRAVVAEGGYHDLGPGTLGEGGNFLVALSRLGSEITYRLVTGVSIRAASPVKVIGQIAPRPILLIYGSREVSLQGAREQLAAAGGAAELWVVEGAGHGDYLYVAPDEYEQRVVAFFDAALLSDR